MDWINHDFLIFKQTVFTEKKCLVFYLPSSRSAIQFFIKLSASRPGMTWNQSSFLWGNYPGSISLVVDRLTIAEQWAMWEENSNRDWSFIWNLPIEVFFDMHRNYWYWFPPFIENRFGDFSSFDGHTHFYFFENRTCSPSIFEKKILMTIDYRPSKDIPSLTAKSP